MKYLILFLIFCSTVVFAQDYEILWSKEIEPTEHSDPNFSYIPYTLGYNSAGNQIDILAIKYENENFDNNKLFLLSINLKTKKHVMQEVADRPFRGKEPFWLSKKVVKDVSFKQDYIEVLIGVLDTGINKLKISKNAHIEEKKLLSKDKEKKTLRKKESQSISKICAVGSSRCFAGINPENGNALLKRIDQENEVIWRREFDTGHTEHFVDVKYCGFIDCIYAIGGVINQAENHQFASKDQHIWLLNVDPSNGEIINDIALPGYSVLGKEPAICCSKSGGIVVVSDRSDNLKNAYVVVTSFPPSLEKELWEKTLHISTSMSSCFKIIPMENSGFIVSFLLNLKDLYIYKLSPNGEVEGAFIKENAAIGGNYDICASGNDIFFVCQKESRVKRSSSSIQLTRFKFLVHE